MRESLGWSLPLINGAVTAGLLVTGVCAYPVGALIDRHGGRVVMTAGSIGAAALYLLWSQVVDPIAFYAIWLTLGVCMAAVLYEPAFAVLTQYFGADSRRAITALTLIAGFASTVFIPLTETLLGVLPWREVLLILAGLHVAICIPVHWWFIPEKPTASAAQNGAEESAHDDGRVVMHRRLRDPVFWGITVWFTAWAATATGVMFQIVPYLKSSGVPTATMLIAVAMVGPMQVTGRVIMMLFGDRARIIVVGAVTTLQMPVAVLILILAPPELLWLGAWAVCFGTANGILTILRGVVPGEWLGREHYGKLMGAMGLPWMVAAALAPLVTASIWSKTGDPQLMLWAIFGAALTGAMGFCYAAVAVMRRRTGATVT